MKSVGNPDLTSAACPPTHWQPPVSCLSLVDPLRVFHLPALWLQASPFLRVCSSVFPLLSVHLSTAFQPSHPSLLPSVWLAPSPLPRPPPFLLRPPGCTSLSLSSHPFLPPAFTSPSFDLFPSRCSSASCLLPWVSSLPASVFLVSTLSVRLSPGFCSLRPFVYLRLCPSVSPSPTFSFSFSRGQSSFPCSPPRGSPLPASLLPWEGGSSRPAGAGVPTPSRPWAVRRG